MIVGFEWHQRILLRSFHRLDLLVLFVGLPNFALLCPDKANSLLKLPKDVDIELRCGCCPADYINEALDSRLERCGKGLSNKLDNLKLVLIEGLLSDEPGLEIEESYSFVNVVDQVDKQVFA